MSEGTETKSAVELAGPPPTTIKSVGVAAFWTVVSAATFALTEFAVQHAAELSALVVSLTANLPTWAAGLVTASLTAAFGWLRQRAKKQQQAKIVEALKTPTPADIDKYY